jgi:hypothetical protein
MELEDMSNRASWELANMKRALESFQFLNTPEENNRLESVKAELRNRRKRKIESVK